MDPFGNQALQYLESGLGYPIPSSYPLEKFPPLVGWTGKQGNTPSRDQVEAWLLSHSNSNILLRLAKNVIGIDVDDYDNKHGADTMRRAYRLHGPLPDAPFSSARGRGYSGIRYYSLDNKQNERLLKGDFGPDSHVEIIRYSHRYAVVPPSWHQGAEARYEWHHANGGDHIPHVSDLSLLPQAWYGHLTQRCECFEELRRAQREQLSRYKRRPYNAQGKVLAQMDFDNNMSMLERMPQGGRNNYLSRVAGRTFLFDCLMNNVLDPDMVWTQLLEAALDAGLETNEITATLHSARAWAMTMNEGDEYSG
jgi:hypothetical protein